MPLRRIITTLFLVALAVPVVLALLAGCETSPTAPVFENIFDPDGPEDGNPLKLRATLGDTSITLSWTQPQDFGFAYYELSHSLNYFNGYLPIGSVDHTTSTFNSFRYSHPTPTTTHYFKIQAFDAAGNFTNVSDQAPAIRSTPPRVEVVGGSKKVASRNITLSVLTSAGDSLRISNHRDFSDETRLAITESGQTQNIPWILPTASSNDTTLTVRVLAFPLTSASDTAVVVLDVNFIPAITVTGNPPTVATQSVELEIPATGLVSMRFAATMADLESQAWIPGNPNHPFNLADTATPQTIWGEFLGDFGFSFIDSLRVIPDLLGDASFALDLPEDHVTDQSIITVLADAVATQMRFSESLDFSGVPWTSYAATSYLNLSSEPGQKVIYGQFRNDWTESAILTDYVVYLSQALEINILAPAGGDQVPSGVAFLVLGTTTVGSGIAAIDSVKFDSGDGAGFFPVVGTTNWTYLWDVPAVSANTARVLRARAWAAEDSVTTAVSVTLLPEVAEK